MEVGKVGGVGILAFLVYAFRNVSSLNEVVYESSPSNVLLSYPILP